MYIPKHFVVDEWEQQKLLIQQYPLGTVITTDEDGKIIANHIPFYLHIDEDGKKYLHAHVARKNHQVPSLTANDNVMVIFQSPNTYISPSYYPGKEDTHKFVPTWDFGSIHIYGKSRIVNEPEFVRTQLENFTNQNESKRELPWKLADAPANYVNLLAKAITGLEIEIDSIEAKFKLEQNMPKKEVDGVVEGLSKDNVPIMSKFIEEVNKA